KLIDQKSYDHMIKIFSKHKKNFIEENKKTIKNISNTTKRNSLNNNNNTENTSHNYIDKTKYKSDDEFIKDYNLLTSKNKGTSKTKFQNSDYFDVETF